MNYVSRNNEGIEEVQEAGFVTSQSVAAFQFVRGEMKDVTASMASKIGVTDKHTYIIPITLKYPDNSTTSKIMFCNCILQMRDIMPTGNSDSRYGSNYIFVGIPEAAIDKLIADMAAQSAVMNMAKITRDSGYCWINVNVGKDQSGSPAKFKTALGDNVIDSPIPEFIIGTRTHTTKNFEMHMWCEVRLKCQTTHVLNNLGSHREWNLGVTFSTAFIVGVTNTAGPSVSGGGKQVFADGNMFNPSDEVAAILASAGLNA